MRARNIILLYIEVFLFLISVEVIWWPNSNFAFSFLLPKTIKVYYRTQRYLMSNIKDTIFVITLHNCLSSSNSCRMQETMYEGCFKYVTKSMSDKWNSLPFYVSCCLHTTVTLHLRNIPMRLILWVVVHALCVIWIFKEKIFALLLPNSTKWNSFEWG